MPTEKALYITGTYGLKIDRPKGDESLSEADNHIRMLKAVIKNTFPNADAPLQVSSDQINNYPEVISSSGDYITLTGPYEYNTEEDKVLRLNANSEIELEVEGSYPIGMVFWSMLTLPQIQNKYNKNGALYVLANGGPVLTSHEYYKITNKLTVPDVMTNKYIRPTYLNRDSSTGTTIKTLEPAEVVQLESTAKEAGFSVTFDSKTHRHNMNHTHKYDYWNDSGVYSGHDSGGVNIANTSGASPNHISGISGLALSSVLDHTHTFTILNTTQGTKNELNRLTVNPFIRIN